VIDPLTAMAAVSTAVNLIKKASKTVDDVRSLGPLLGKYFDAKHEATKAVNHAKKKGGSNMGAAIQAELELMQQKSFEEELKMLFFQSGNADVWQNIQIRVAQMNRDDAHNARKEKEAAERRRKAIAQAVETGIGVVLILAALGGMGYMAVLGYGHCKETRQCGF
jgi:cell division septum initiation protein DivIVA